MANKNILKEKIRQYPLIAVAAVIIVGFVTIKLAGGQKPEYFEKQGVISNTEKVEPSQQAKAVEQLLSDDQQGIVSFEMYVPQKKQAPAALLSREEIIQQIIAAISGIKDDVKAQNTIITRITSLDFKLGGLELANILRSSNIEDPFYYANIIKRIAPLLEYPMTERQMKAIVEPVTDDYYRHKLFGELVKEQLRHK